MFDNINDVPLPIADFYMTETRQVQQLEEDGSPTLQDVKYQYEDIDGVMKTGSRLDPVFVSTDIVVKVPVGNRKAIEDIWPIIVLNRGKNDDFIKQFLAMVCNANQWRFHDKYLTWYQEEPKQDDDCFLVYENEDIADTKVFSQELFNAAYQKWQAAKPPKPAKIDVDEWFLDNYKPLRAAAFLPLEEQADMRYHDRINGTNTCDEHIAAVKAQYPKA